MKTKILKRITVATAILLVILCIALVVILIFSSSDSRICEIELAANTPSKGDVVVNCNSLEVTVTDGQSAFAALNCVSDAYGYGDAKQEFDIENTNAFNGDSYYCFTQKKDEIPVHGKSMIVAVDERGKVFSISGNYKQINDDFVTAPSVDSKNAQKQIERAMKKTIDDGLSVSEPQLCIYADTQSPVLTWAAEVYGYDDNEEFQAWTVFLDAHKSKIVQMNSNINYDRITNTYYGQRDIIREISVEQTKNGNKAEYEMRDTERKITVYEPKDKYYWWNVNQKGVRKIVSWNQNEEPNKSAVDAMDNVAKTYDFFYNILGQKGMGKSTGGGEIAVVVNTKSYKVKEENKGKGLYGSVRNSFQIDVPDYTNKFNVGTIAFTVDPAKKYEASANLDVVAHEFTHGVTKLASASDLTLCGALNEAYSDIFGELVEAEYYIDADWIHGERNLKQPEGKYMAKYDPEFVMEENEDCYRLSTVISHAAYLMWAGGTDASSAIKDYHTLAKLWYSSQFMLTEESDFADCRVALESAAFEMYSDGELTESQLHRVSNAFDEVNIESKARYEGVSPDAQLHVISGMGTKFYNYSCKVEEVIYDVKDHTQPNEGEFRISNNSSIYGIASITPQYTLINEFNVTEKSDIRLSNLEVGKKYLVTVSDLSQHPLTPVTKLLYVTEKGKDSIVFETMFVSDTKQWTHAYIEHIRNSGEYRAYKKEIARNDGIGSMSYNRFYLIYVDEDDVPELFLEGSSTAQGSKLMVYDSKSDCVNEYSTWVYAAEYIPFTNLFMHTDGHMDMYEQKICSIEDGNVVVKYSGEYGAHLVKENESRKSSEYVYGYKWEGQSMTKSQYDQAVNGIYDASRSIKAYDKSKFGGLCFDEMIEYLSNM